LLLARALWLAALLPAVALAQRETTRESLARLEETLQMRLADGGFETKDLLPAIVVSLTPAFEETRAWYPTAALAALVHVFGGAGLRSCEACMAPRVWMDEGRIEEDTSGLSTAEIVRFDESARGSGPPARAAIWLDENPGGVSLQMIDLQNGRVVLAENFDPKLREAIRTRKAFTEARALERRARGDSIVHTFIDLTLFPMQHVSLDWAEQWGDSNENLSGLTISGYDPVLGVGAAYFRIIPSAANMAIGAKVILSVPTAIISAVSGQWFPANFDPLVTGVLMVRAPVFNSNYAIVASVSTAGRFGIGISLMNLTLLPVVP